jgi:geranylgeranyl diphosphate synthase type I
MWQKSQINPLKEEIEAILSPLSIEPTLFNILKDPLEKVGRGLASEDREGAFPLLPLMVCEAITGDYERAIPAAAALQLFMAAGDVFDDIEDEDSPNSLSKKYSNAVAINAATTLLILAEKGLTRRSSNFVKDSTIVRISDVVNSFYATACAGQHLDLTFASENNVSEATYLKIVSMKSASQIECACQVGALLANAGPELVENFSSFGYNLGMAAQITNDIRGIISGKDILTPRLTLPVIYALDHASSDALPLLKKAFSKKSEVINDAAPVQELLFRTGAIFYSTTQMELYKEHALINLTAAEKTGARIERFRVFFG